MAQKLLLFWRKPARRCWWEGVELDDVEGVEGKLKVWIRRVWTLEMVSQCLVGLQTLVVAIPFRNVRAECLGSLQQGRYGFDPSLLTTAVCRALSACADQQTRLVAHGHAALPDMPNLRHLLSLAQYQKPVLSQRQETTPSSTHPTACSTRTSIVLHTPALTQAA